MNRAYMNVDQMLQDALREIRDVGLESEARGRKFYDIPCWSGTLLNPRARVVQNPARRLRPGYNAASVAWNLAQRNDVDSICWWNEKGRAISDDGKTFNGANYGQRMMDELDEAIHLLKLDPGTRRAWVPIWRPYDLLDDRPGPCATGPDPTRYSREGKDVPCTIGFGLSYRQDAWFGHVLDMSVVMRSNSAFFVFPYDVYLFSVIQELVANELAVALGQLRWFALSMHVYESEWEICKNALDPPPFVHTPMDPIDMTLSRARVEYPKAMDRFMRDQSAPILEFPVDPVIKELYEGSKEIASA